MGNAQAQMNLTRRQKCVYDYLRERRRATDHAPTLDEICTDLGLRSRGSLHKHVQALVEAGLVFPLGGKQRGVQLVEGPESADGGGQEVPFLGVIAAGRPLEAIVDRQTLSVPEHLLGKGRCYVLQVRGDSMVEAGILDGDWVVIEQQSQARNGTIVVALVDGVEATLKRIEQYPDRIELHPANRTMEPVVLRPEQVLVQGVLVGQMRSYR